MPNTYNPTTYFTAEAGLSQAVTEMNALMTRLEALRTTAAAIEQQVSDMFVAAPVGWDGLFSFIDAQALAFPDNPAWQALKARKDMVHPDFQMAQARTQNVNAAIQGL